MELSTCRQRKGGRLFASVKRKTRSKPELRSDNAQSSADLSWITQNIFKRSLKYLARQYAWRLLKIEVLVYIEFEMNPLNIISYLFKIIRLY